MAAHKMKVLIAAVAAMVLTLAAGVAYANSGQPTSTGGGQGGQQVAGNDRSDVSGAAEDEAGPGDADEAGDVDGPGDTED